MNSMLAIEEETQVDDSIQSYKRFAYLPISGTNLNNANPIVIRVENSDNYFRPCDSEIEFEGKVLKADGTVYKKAEAAKLTLINNGLMFLFDNIKYELSSTEIESVNNPGQATSMFGLLTKNENYNNGGGLNSCWAVDDDMGEAKDGNSGWDSRRKMIFVNNVVAADAEDPNSGSFRFSVKLEDIFGFATDYHRVMYGFVHTLTLIRNVKHNDAMFGAAGATAGKVQFSKISWILPHVEPSQVANYELVKLINEQRTLSIDFRARQCLTTVLPESDTFLWRLGVRTSPEKPRFIVVGFQKDREGSLEKNLGLFDHCDLKNTYILLNNQRYPAMDYNADFLKNRYNKLYREFYQFMQKFYGISESVTSTSVDSIAYKHLFPLIVYDVSRQSERIQQAVVDITIQCYFSKSVPAKTKAYCLMISDRRLKFKSDGTKANIVY
jgi:hypothetical protein